MPDSSKPNFTSSGIDALLWPLIAVPSLTERSADVIAWTETNHGVPGGFDFNSDRDGVWLEGTAQAARSIGYLGHKTKAETLFSTINDQVAPNKLVYATDKDQITTGLSVGPGSAPGDFKYYRLPHVGATAWAVLAALDWNPFVGRSAAVPTVDFAYSWETRRHIESREERAKGLATSSMPSSPQGAMRGFDKEATSFPGPRRFQELRKQNSHQSCLCDSKAPAANDLDGLDRRHTVPSRHPAKVFLLGHPMPVFPPCNCPVERQLFDHRHAFLLHPIATMPGDVKRISSSDAGARPIEANQKGDKRDTCRDAGPDQVEEVAS